MILDGEHEPEAFLETLRAGVGDRLLPLTPVTTEFGVVMGAARVLTLDHLKLDAPPSIQPAVATISLDRDNRVGLEYHTRQSILLDSGVVTTGGLPDRDCESFVIDDETVINQRGGRIQSEVPYRSMFSPPWEHGHEQFTARGSFERIKGVLRFLEQVRHPDESERVDDVFDPAKPEARQAAMSILNDTGWQWRLFPRIPLPGELEPGFSGYIIQHRIVDRAAWVALEGLRPQP